VTAIPGPRSRHHRLQRGDPVDRNDVKYGFLDRGNAFQAKGDLDHAIAGHDQMLRLDTTSGRRVAFEGRAEAYMAKGNLDGAVSDRSQVASN
jgi:hypothetical protein